MESGEEMKTKIIVVLSVLLLIVFRMFQTEMAATIRQINWEQKYNEEIINCEKKLNEEIAKKEAVFKKHPRMRKYFK